MRPSPRPTRTRRWSPTTSGAARRSGGGGAGAVAAPRRPRYHFPQHLALARQPRTIAAWHPRGPHETEVWRWYLVDADAPAEVKDFLRHYYIRYSGPSGLTEQDDMENWNYAHAASRGTVARRYPYNYEMGLGRATSRVRGPRPQVARRDQRRDGGQRERAQSARLLRALAPVHGSRELGGARAAVSAGSPDLGRLLLKQEVEDFLYREADLLDERRYEEWLDLFTEDARYWMPMRRNVPATSPSGSSPGRGPTSTGSTRARRRSPGA